VRLISPAAEDCSGYPKGATIVVDLLDDGYT